MCCIAMAPSPNTRLGTPRYHPTLGRSIHPHILYTCVLLPTRRLLKVAEMCASHQATGTATPAIMVTDGGIFRLKLGSMVEYMDIKKVIQLIVSLTTSSTIWSSMRLLMLFIASRGGGYRNFKLRHDYNHACVQQHLSNHFTLPLPPQTHIQSIPPPQHAPMCTAACPWQNY